MKVANEIEVFSKLLQAAHVVSNNDIHEATVCAKRLEVSLERALTMLKLASEERLRPAIRAKEMVTAGRISLEEATSVLRHASQNGIPFEEALPEKQATDSSLRLSPGKVNHPLAEFFLSSKLITQDQLNQGVHKSQTMDLPLGKTLVINRLITRDSLGQVLYAARLLSDGVVSKEQAFKLLHDAIQHRISVIQVLFESGNYKLPTGNDMSLTELLIMGECLTEADYQDIEERQLVENKTHTQLIAEYKIVESSLLESAIELLQMVGNYLKPFQAAEALKQVRSKKVPVYQAIAELKPPPQVTQPELRLGDLLVEAGIISRPSIESAGANSQPRTSLIRIGKQLLDAHIIDDTNLYNALRCQSLYREGMISAQQAVASLSSAHDDKIKLEEAFIRCNIYAPIRMQWNWR